MYWINDEGQTFASVQVPNKPGEVCIVFRTFDLDINPELLDKSRLIAITKSDLLDAELEKEITSDLGKSINVPFIFISSISNVGLSKLKDKIWKMLN